MDAHVGLVSLKRFEAGELRASWIEGDGSARWRSGPGPVALARASGTSLLEIAPGRRLPMHTDSAEETIVIVSGSATLTVQGNRFTLGPGGVGVIPADARHEVTCAGPEPLRFVALYASADVVTTYDEPVEPEGKRSRIPF